MTALLLVAAAASTPDLTICADRPSKANGVCTVPVGHWQLEVSGVDWAHSSDTDVTTIGQTFAKLGLSDRSDIEVGFTPYVSLRQPGSDESGVGDVVVRYKQRLTGDDAPVQITLLPFVKLPTARHSIGNNKVEGGFAVPIAVPAGPITVTVGPEIDALVDGDGHGYHAAITNLVNLGWSATPKLSLSVEAWNNVNFDPADTIRQWSADASAAYLLNKRVQLDTGANFGLSRATPDVELYGGVSVLF